ncbi:hypothetical protein BDW59DRAFT_159124 [Aspergillus cavernicola]|uniref:Uncharacterized protein n=1 Tax=Aspergillus cavernicola TaxID=176166 RepID=A0ABR4IP61_9EURO
MSIISVAVAAFLSTSHVLPSCYSGLQPSWVVLRPVLVLYPFMTHLSISPGAIFKRQTAYPGSSAQARVFQTAQPFDLTGTDIMGSNGSPYTHEFGNRKGLNLPDCPGVPAPFQEFPILANGGTFGGDGSTPPGTDRIVYKITGTDPATGLPDSFAFCGVMTHLGTPGNNFVDCDDA